MPLTPDNLSRLHLYEESIRTQSLAAIEDNEALSDHLRALHDSLDHLTVLLQAESAPGERTHTLQLLAIRLFNCGGSALKLGLSGYYQVAFQVLRDSLELVNLVDLFRIDEQAIETWRTADDKTLKKAFGPVQVRLRLEQHPTYAGQRRDAAYSTLSGYAAHPSYKGFQLVAPANKPRPGPFFDSKLLFALLEDLGRHISHAALGVSCLIEQDELSLLKAKNGFLAGLRTYHDKYPKR